MDGEVGMDVQASGREMERLANGDVEVQGSIWMF